MADPIEPTGAMATDYILASVAATDEIVRFENDGVTALPPITARLSAPLPKGRKLTLVAQVRPRLADDMQIPAVMLSAYAEVIAAGVKARMMAMPGKEWSNPQMAAYYQERYRKGVADARWEKCRGQGAMEVYNRPFGG